VGGGRQEGAKNAVSPHQVNAGRACVRPAALQKNPRVFHRARPESSKRCQARPWKVTAFGFCSRDFVTGGLVRRRTWGRGLARTGGAATARIPRRRRNPTGLAHHSRWRGRVFDCAASGDAGFIRGCNSGRQDDDSLFGAPLDGAPRNAMGGTAGSRGTGTKHAGGRQIGQFRRGRKVERGRQARPGARLDENHWGDTEPRRPSRVMPRTTRAA